MVQQAGQPVGHVVSVTGNVGALCVTRDLDVEVHPVQVGDAIYAQDVLQTGEGGSIEVAFLNGREWTLGPDAEVEVDPRLWTETQYAENEEEQPIDFDNLEPTAAGNSGPVNDDGTGIVILERGNESDPYQSFQSPGLDTEGVLNDPLAEGSGPAEDAIIPPLVDGRPLFDVFSIQDGQLGPPRDSVAAGGLRVSRKGFFDFEYTKDSDLFSDLEFIGPDDSDVIFRLQLGDVLDEDLTLEYFIGPTVEFEGGFFLGTGGAPYQTGNGEVTIPAGETEATVWVDSFPDPSTDTGGETAQITVWSQDYDGADPLGLNIYQATGEFDDFNGLTALL